MKVRFWLMAAAATLLAVLLPLGCAPDSASAGGSALPPANTTQPTGIHVTGEGKVMATPDLAVAILGVEVSGERLGAVHRQVTAKMEKVMKALADAGIDEKDIKTVRFYMSPERRRKPFTLKGEEELEVFFREVNLVSVKIRDINAAGAVLDGAIAAGANKVESISFTVEDPKALQRQARDAAMADAKAKAEQMAQQAGVVLGKPSYIAESGLIPVPRAFGLGVAEAGGDVSISPGEMEITVTVSVIYDIE